MTPQERVYQSVSDRGYTRNWTDDQFLARQLAKLTEEVAEAVGGVAVDAWTPTQDWLEQLHWAGQSARAAFDDAEMWDNAGPEDAVALRKELADCQVVLFCAAQALARHTGESFDVVTAAVEKATADVTRGVRGA